MKSITYSAARETLASTMQQVCDDAEPIIITRKRDQAVVMMSLTDFESLQETTYLMRSSANAKRLRNAIDQLESAKGTARELPAECS